jgi:uncharacterized protein
VIVISDTSVISNLLIIGELDLLRAMYQEILIPTAVHTELRALENTDINYAAYQQANWIQVRDPENRAFAQRLQATLDRGESEAIALALELPGSYLAIDEKAGRHVAKSLGIKIVGLVGILIQAKARGLITGVKPFLDQMIQDAGFYLSKNLYQQVLQDQGEWNPLA